jgi:chromosome partitioning protein
MKVIALVTRKGGSGKTTIALNLAVLAWQKGSRVMVLDCDTQCTASQWYESRSEQKPDLIQVREGELQKALPSLHGYDLVVIDTPPRAESINAVAVNLADYTLIPCVPSLADMRAQKASVDSIESLNKRGAFVLNRVPPRGQRGNDAAQGLAVFGLPVVPAHLGYRQVFPDAYAASQGVSEFEPEGKGAVEITELWKWVQKKL